MNRDQFGDSGSLVVSIQSKRVPSASLPRGYKAFHRTNTDERPYPALACAINAAKEIRNATA